MFYILFGVRLLKTVNGVLIFRFVDIRMDYIFTNT